MSSFELHFCCASTASAALHEHIIKRVHLEQRGCITQLPTTLGVAMLALSNTFVSDDDGGLVVMHAAYNSLKQVTVQATRQVTLQVVVQVTVQVRVQVTVQVTVQVAVHSAATAFYAARS